MSENRKSLFTVYQRKGKWVVGYIDIDGKQKLKTLKDAAGEYPVSKLQATQIARNLLADLRAVQNIRSEQELLNRFAEKQQLINQIFFKLDHVLPMIENDPRLKNGTRLQFRKFQWQKFHNWIKTNYPQVTSPHEITAAMAQQFASALYDEGMANSTYNDYLMTYCMLFNMMISQGGLTKNPFAEIKRLPKETESHQPIPSEYIPLLLAACNDDNFSVIPTTKLTPITKEDLKTLVIIGICTGMRLKDCALLTWDKINLDRRFITVVAAKTRRFNKRPLMIPLLPKLSEHLNRIYSDGISGYVMPTIAHRYIDEERHEHLSANIKSDNGGISNEIKNLLAYVGLPVNERISSNNSDENKTSLRRKKRPNVYGFHSFRHNFVSVCAANNIPLAYVEAIIGDDSSVLREYYTHINIEDMQNRICGIQADFLGKSPFDNNETLVPKIS